MKFSTNKGIYFEVDDRDVCIVGHWAWRVNNAGYVQRGVRENGSTSCVLLHRQVWEAHYGEISKDKEIHHIDENKLNNFLENLALVTRRFNVIESKPNSTGFSGVSKSSGKRNKPFTARLRVQGKLKSLGYYKTPEEAHKAYLRAVQEIE